MSIASKLDSIAYRVRMAGADLPDIIEALKSLRILDQSLDGLEQSFEARFEERLAASVPTIDPEIKNQIDAYSKAKEGLEKSKIAKKALEELLKVLPDEKAATRALEEANRLVGKYERHIEAGKKIISTAAKKTMPPHLKKMTNDVAKLVKDRLADPDALEITPWQEEVKVYQDRWTSTMGVGYTVLFKVPNVDSKYEEYDERDRPVWKVKKVSKVWVLKESFLMAVAPGTAPPLYASNDHGNIQAASAKVVADHFLQTLTGWSGLKGEDDSRKRREGVSAAISSILNGVIRKWGKGYGTETPRWDANFLVVEAGLSRYGKEPEDRYHMQETIDREISQMYKEIEAALKPYAAFKPKVVVGLGDKGYVEISVEIK